MKEKKAKIGRPVAGDRVISVDKHPKGWRLRYSENGRTRCEYRVKEESILERKKYHQTRLAGKDVPAARAVASKSGNSADWADALWSAAQSVLEDTANENLRAVARTVAQLASSAAKHIDMADTVRRIDALEANQKQDTIKRKHGNRVKGATVPTRTPPRPGQPV